MSFVFMVVHWPRPDRLADLASSMRAMGDTMLTEPGCTAVEPPLVTDDREQLIGISHWTSKEAFLAWGITMPPPGEIVKGELRPRARYMLEAFDPGCAPDS